MYMLSVIVVCRDSEDDDDDVVVVVVVVVVLRPFSCRRSSRGSQNRSLTL